ncbi:hypothetical protein MASR2M78_15610 [Treponema sp.]
MKSDGVICVSNNTLSDLKYFYPNYKKPIKVIYNGKSNDYKQLNSVNKNNTILFVGSRVDYKNFEYAVKLTSNLNDYIFIIVGGGDLTSNELRILEHNLPNKYRIVGNIKNEDLNKMYNEAFFLLYPSSMKALLNSLLSKLRQQVVLSYVAIYLQYQKLLVMLPFTSPVMI